MGSETYMDTYNQAQLYFRLLRAIGPNNPSIHVSDLSSYLTVFGHHYHRETILNSSTALVRHHWAKC